ncbi:MAG: HAMP domain-containing histidine kinase [Sedimentisphaerales bacterium]|nr:HAMP domain-containing histidine kinase [Sedimentisphaerales bacterium]
MYRRLIILSLIIIAAFSGLSWLGYRAISMWVQGIEGTRITEFADVAEQIRFDVNDTLDTFRKQEQSRPYTDYQYYSIPEDTIIANQDVQLNERASRRSGSVDRIEMESQDIGNNVNGLNPRQVAVKVSPLADDIEHDLAYFNFQYDNDSNTLTSPNGFVEQQKAQVLADSPVNLNKLLESNFKNVQENVIPALEKSESKDSSDSKRKLDGIVSELKRELNESLAKESIDEITTNAESSNKRALANTKQVSKGNTASRTGSYNIEGLQNSNDEPQVQMQSREFVSNNVGQNSWNNSVQVGEITDMYLQQERPSQIINGATSQFSQSGRIPTDEMQQQIPQQPIGGGRGGRGGMGSFGGRARTPQATQMSDAEESQVFAFGGQRAISLPALPEPNQADIVEVIIEPFSTIVIPEENNKDSIFGGQVFMVRRVKIEGKELYQGFQLNEKKLLEKVEDSTKRFVRDGMSYELGRKLNGNSAYTAILDFGFGHLLLNLFEDDPGRFMVQISHLRTWYFSIISVVFLAVTVAVISLWMNAREQIMLAQKKDDFVSAVSHELRTPLTSIRMHAEMLEKNWIKSEDKLGEYYRSMRTESERLSRLIENVLDFSRIQKGRKKYLFKLGDINKCVTDVVEMMRAYAAQRGFQIQMQSGECGEIAFDSDAVTQIVVNLIDNAVKYSSNSEDKKIMVRTKSDGQYILIEVEDRGPGIPHRQRNKIFQEFYRIGAESTRETTGSGLGLALVKRFAQAHNGFVEIINAIPTGAIFRVSLATKLQNNI